MPVEPSSAPPRTEDIALDPIKYPATNALDRSAPIKSSRGAGPKNGEDQVADNASSPNGEGQQTDQDDEDQGDDLDWRGTVLLAVQHASSSWGYRSAEFAYPLYFIELFTNSLLPASIYGFVTTGVGIALSGSTGALIDRYAASRVRTVRTFIVGQKVLTAASYALFLILFLHPPLEEHAENGGRGPEGIRPRYADVWTLFAAITVLGCGLILSNVGVSVSVERDWVSTISAGSSARLTRLNAIMRRIDLLSKLLSPLFVSALTTGVSYPASAVILLGLCGLSSVFELCFIGVVYRRFPILAADEARIRQAREEAPPGEAAASQSTGDPRDAPADGSSVVGEGNGQTPLTVSKPASTLAGRCEAGLRRLKSNGVQAIRTWSLAQYHDWRAFAALPVFISSVCISLLYMSVLSFDSTFLAYLKSETDYSDAFIAGMRAVCVVAGLLGTVVMPRMEKWIGLVRTGTWSLWLEFLPLTPALVSFYVGAVRHRPPWNSAMLFTGLAVSRIGLWSFDLAQLAQLQMELNHHPRRNALTALQYALQNVFDLAHYGLTIGWNKPGQFSNAAAVSYGAIGASTLLYMVYVRRVRGHLVHLDTLGLQSLLGKKKA